MIVEEKVNSKINNSKPYEEGMLLNLIYIFIKFIL